MQIILPDTYSHRLMCGNCTASSLLKIPLGLSVQKYAEDHDCSYCGCKLFSKDEWVYDHATSPTIYLPYGLRRRV